MNWLDSLVDGVNDLLESKTFMRILKTFVLIVILFVLWLGVKWIFPETAKGAKQKLISTVNWVDPFNGPSKKEQLKSCQGENDSLNVVVFNLKASLRQCQTEKADLSPCPDELAALKLHHDSVHHKIRKAVQKIKRVGRPGNKTYPDTTRIRPPANDTAIVEPPLIVEDTTEIVPPPATTAVPADDSVKVEPKIDSTKTTKNEKGYVKPTVYGNKEKKNTPYNYGKEPLRVYKKK